jgi:hypothetical protein
MEWFSDYSDHPISRYSPVKMAMLSKKCSFLLNFGFQPSWLQIYKGEGLLSYAVQGRRTRNRFLCLLPCLIFSPRERSEEGRRPSFVGFRIFKPNTQDSEIDSCSFQVFSLFLHSESLAELSLFISE